MQDIEVELVGGENNEDENKNEVDITGNITKQISRSSTFAPVLTVSDYKTREEKNDVSELIFVNFK